MNTHSAENDATCCACSGVAVARVHDGSFRKPVCAVHRRVYAQRGYLLDELRSVIPPGESTCAACEREGLCEDCCEDGAFSDPQIHHILTRVIPPASTQGDDA